MYRGLLLLLLVQLSGFAQAIQPPSDDSSAQATGSVDGRVTNAETGEGISGATIRLISVGKRRTTASADRTVTSQGDGSFMVDGLAPGNYLIIASQSSFTPGPNGRQSRPTVQIEPGQAVSNISIQLSPIGRIRGKVVDEDGHPVPGATVQAFATYSVRGKIQLRRVAEAATDESGKYILRTQESGKYYVSAEVENDPSPTKPEDETRPSEKPNVEFVRTFYPKSLNSENATPLDMSGGQDVSDVNIQLLRSETHHIRGKIEGLDIDSARPPMISLAPRGSLASDGLGKVVRAGRDGTFDIQKVIPGSYTLSVTGVDNSNSTPDRRPFRERLLARQDIDVGGDDVNGTVLTVVPLMTLSGRVDMDGLDNTDMSQVRVNLIPSGAGAVGGFQSVRVQRGGTFEIENLAPGQYVVRVSGTPSGTYIRSVSYNHRDITNTGIDLTEGGGGEIEIVLRTGTGEVDGALETSTQVSATTVMVLVPDTVSLDGSGVLFGNIQSSGSLVIRNVPPGHYYAYAIERWSPFWQNPEFLRNMRNQGVSVDLPENGHLQVRLSIISAEQVDAAAAPLGLTAQ
jgi:hypothetical protein